MTTQTTDDLEARIAAVRRFSRFYTRELGLLREGLVGAGYSLTEGRVLYELAHRDKVTASELAAALDMDHGYLSRILRRFGDDGLLKKVRAPNDARQSLITITAKGRKAFAPLNKGSHDQVAEWLGRLSEAEQARVVGAMAAVESLLSHKDTRPDPILLRPHRPGDMGWVTSAHGAIYANEYGWDITFEAMVAKIVAEFIENFDAKRECCWIAEMDGVPVGSSFVVNKGDGIAKLRLVIVDAKARGLGVGKRLVEECMRFAKSAGYKSMTLWTQDNLTAARGIYQRAGFKLVGSEANHSFGVDLVSETWEREL
jgi:DNA-binding MarR family transcriptional regulator/GNAT superfamily N-acetyltransferase